MTREQRDAMVRTLRESGADPVVVTIELLEELVADADSLEDELADATEELECWRRTYA